MCVIVLVDSEARRPSETMIDLMWTKNPDGGGAAWREEEDGEPTMVCWEKGLMKEAGRARMKELAATLPIPYILHMRIATIGGIVPNMTHPFPIHAEGLNVLKGKTQGSVLFHNGTYSDWDKDVKSLAISTGTPIPSGKWSDSRGLAWICSVIGNGFMDLLPTQKGLAFGPDGDTTFIYRGKDNWEQAEDPETGEKVWCSNTHFLPVGSNGVYNVAPYCSGPRNCFRKDALDKNGRCPEHPIKALNAGSEVTSNVTPFPPTPKDTDKPEGPVLSLGRAEKAYKLGKIGKDFLNSVKRAHERMKKGSPKDSDRAKRQLIVAGAMPHFSGLPG